MLCEILFIGVEKITLSDISWRKFRQEFRGCWNWFDFLKYDNFLLNFGQPLKEIPVKFRVTKTWRMSKKYTWLKDTQVIPKAGIPVRSYLAKICPSNLKNWTISKIRTKNQSRNFSDEKIIEENFFQLLSLFRERHVSRTCLLPNVKFLFDLCEQEKRRFGIRPVSWHQHITLVRLVVFELKIDKVC